MENPRNFFQRHWKLILITTGIALLAYILLFRQLGGLTGAYSTQELASQTQASSLHDIYSNPVNAPYKLLVWTGLKLGHHSLLITRIAAAAIAVGVATLFYWVAVHWYSKRVALLSSILFIGSSGFLHIGRYGTALILQMATLLLIACVLLYRRARRETPVTYLIVVLLALCLYVPGIFWFELLGLALLHKHIWRLFNRLGWLHGVAILTLGIGITIPILWASIQNPAVLREILALPAHVPTVASLWQQAKELGGAIVYRGYYSPEFWLYGSPLLNTAEMTLFLAGVFVLIQTPRLRKDHYIVGAMLVSIALILLGGSATIAMLIPLMYLVIAGGIYYLLDQWLTIFPRNPIARGLGVGLICITASFSAYYHVQAYYVAWPQAPETEQVYTIKS
jgi:hypothetical protein